MDETLNNNKIFEKFKIKDIVFLAITSAAMLLTSAVMPLVLGIPMFGLPQLVTGLQMSLFPAIALMKVRKVGSMFFMALFTGIFQLIMAPPVFVANMIISLLLEAIMILGFKGFKKNIACFLTAALYNPLSLPFGFLYHWLINKKSANAIIYDKPWIAVIISLSVLALCSLGAFLGILIAKELTKSGVLKSEVEEEE